MSTLSVEECEEFTKQCKSLYLQLINFLESEVVMGKYSIGVHCAVFNTHLDYLKKNVMK